jgi:endoglucanase
VISRREAAATVMVLALSGAGCRRPRPSPPPPAEAGDLGLASTIAGASSFSPFVVVDQFGYLPSMGEKMAVLRSPRRGFDAKRPFSPGPVYALVDAKTGAPVLKAAPTAWNGGAEDPSSGDQAWWFDFSKIEASGQYYVLDESAGARSPSFTVSSSVYARVLDQAVRMFFYQRDGIAKEARYAGADWADGVAHPQDVHCGIFPTGASPLDLHGGWFDAGDQNRYTTFACSDVIELLRGYAENPQAFGDDSAIPESANGVADLLDEVKWELDWLARMQTPEGAVLSLAGHAGASPPSRDTSPCQYGPPTTAATLAAAGAFAYASIVLGSASGAAAAYPGLAVSFGARAESAWAWAAGHPHVGFSNSAVHFAGGEQDLGGDDLERRRLQAAVLLFELTGKDTYRGVVDQGYTMLEAAFDPFHEEPIDTALEYTRIPGATGSTVGQIRGWFRAQIEGESGFGAIGSPRSDPYFAYLPAYTWGSNQIKAAQGNLLMDVDVFKVDAPAAPTARSYAARYVHYLHGVNPLSLVYLSNMSAFGAESSVTRFYHSWFARGSRWEGAGVSPYGPPPGFLTGGPNPGYSWDDCCPSRCGRSCGPAPLSPPAGQPPQKSYANISDGWPLDTWSVTEPDLGYQAKYVRLLSKFVSRPTAVR